MTAEINCSTESYIRYMLEVNAHCLYQFMCHLCVQMQVREQNPLLEKLKAQEYSNLKKNSHKNTHTHPPLRSLLSFKILRQVEKSCSQTLKEAVNASRHSTNRSVSVTTYILPRIGEEGRQVPFHEGFRWANYTSNEFSEIRSD